MTEPYLVEYSQDAQDILEKMGRKTAKRIMDKLDDAARNPDHFFERLSGREDYKLRVGDYRIIYRIHGHEVIILKIGHRKDVYPKVFARLSK